MAVYRAGAGADATNFLPNRWNPTLFRQANEELVVAADFNPAEIESVGNNYFIRKILTFTSTSMGANAGALTYANTSDLVVTGTLYRDYTAVQIANEVVDRMDVDIVAPKKAQLVAGLATGLDVNAGVLAASLSTNVVGGATVAGLDEPTLALVTQKLATNGKDHFKIGVTPVYMKVHPSQISSVIQIFNLTADYIRGDGERPKVSGWVSKALGMQMNESGNVYQSAGITHNLAYIDQCFVKGFNRQPMVLSPQPFDDTVKYIAVVEYMLVEAFDEYGVDVQTAA